MFTIVASSTTMSWARPTVPRMSHRREPVLALVLLLAVAPVTKTRMIFPSPLMPSSLRTPQRPEM